MKKANGGRGRHAPGVRTHDPVTRGRGCAPGRGENLNETAGGTTRALPISAGRIDPINSARREPEMISLPWCRRNVAR
jgi:hypothetical protein